MSRKKKAAPNDDEEEYGPFTPQDYVEILGFDPWEDNGKLTNPTGVKRSFVDPRVMLKTWGRIDDYSDVESGKKALRKQPRKSRANCFAQKRKKRSKRRTAGKKRKPI